MRKERTVIDIADLPTRYMSSMHKRRPGGRTVEVNSSVIRAMRTGEEEFPQKACQMITGRVKKSWQ